MKNQAKKIVTAMIENDYFSKWLGIEVIDQAPGSSLLQMSVRKEMLNGFHILHGGVSYALADSALAFASNCHGRKSVSLETSISHIEACTEADVLTAEAKEVSLSEKIGIYHVKVKNQHQKTIALFKGTVYRTNKKWDLNHL
jgi:acyl-CoA thioesterase